MAAQSDGTCVLRLHYIIGPTGSIMNMMMMICFCGINPCIAFKRVVFKTVHCVLTEVCSGNALHVIEEGGKFRINTIPVSVPKNEYVAVRSILSIGSRIDLYVYYVVVGFSDGGKSFEMLEC